MSNIENNRSGAIDQLFRGILSLRNVDECYQFFSDLLTVQELTSFAHRFEVAKLLAGGSTYDRVREQVPVSSSTITRINTELRYGSGGYQMVLDRLEPEEKERRAAILESLRNLPFA